MDPFTAIASYLIIWWISLFIILPLDVKTQAEDGNIVKGSAKSAPTNLNFKKKALWASLLALLLWGVLIILSFSNIIKL